MIVLNQLHLRHLINEYVLYYLEDRTHLAVDKGTPRCREAMEYPGGGYKVISTSRLRVCIIVTIVLPELLVPASLVKTEDDRHRPPVQGRILPASSRLRAA